MAVLVRILLFSLFMIGAMSKPQGGLAGQSLAEDNCEFLKGKDISQYDIHFWPFLF